MKTFKQHITEGNKHKDEIADHLIAHGYKVTHGKGYTDYSASKPVTMLRHLSIHAAVEDRGWEPKGEYTDETGNHWSYDHKKTTGTIRISHQHGAVHNVRFWDKPNGKIG